MTGMVSCERDANVALPEVESKIVLRCFISPNDTDIVARVTQSDPVFGSSSVGINDPITNAVVVISDGITQANLTYHEFAQAYVIHQSVYPVFPGRQYIISVVAPGLKSVNATTIVPEAAPVISNWNISIEDTVDAEFEQRINVNGGLYWSNPIADPGYYSVQVSRVAANEYFEEQYVTNSFDTFFKKLEEVEEPAPSYSLNLKSSFYLQGYVEPSDTAYFELYLLNVNSDYYHFNRSMENAMYSDPFTEPSFVYSNVVGGLGVFAAYNGVRSVLP